jgi:nucleoside-diphosphate-sugar epimerase
MGKWHRVDVLDRCAAASLISTVRPSHLVMAAWTTTHGDYWSDPKNDDWARATEALAQCFYEQRHRRAVLVGSCAQYDWNDPVLAQRAIFEDDARGRPLTAYGRAKRHVAESVAAIAANHAGEFAEARLFFTTGPGENLGRFVPTIVNAILSERPANLGPANVCRDFMDVRDVGAAIASLLDGGVVGAVNIGTGTPRRLSEVASRVGEMMGRPDLIRIGAIKLRADEPAMLVANPRRLSAEVGFQPRHSLDEALLASINFWKATRSN